MPKPGGPGGGWPHGSCGHTTEWREPAAKGRHCEEKPMTMLDGPRIGPPSGPARRLVVFLHGYGADGNDLIDIGRQWQKALPDAAFVAPHAPEPCAGAPYGRQWFPLTFRDPDERWRGVRHAQPALDSFLETELGRLGLGPGDLA